MIGDLIIALRLALEDGDESARGPLADALEEAGHSAEALRIRRNWKWWVEAGGGRKWFGPQNNLMAAIASVGPEPYGVYYWRIWHGQGTKEEGERPFLKHCEAASTYERAQAAAEHYLLEHGN